MIYNILCMCKMREEQKTVMHLTSELELLYDLFSLIFLDPNCFFPLLDSESWDLDCPSGVSVLLSSACVCFIFCASPFPSFSFSLRLSLMIILSRISPLGSEFSNFLNLFIRMLSASSDLELEFSFIFLRSKFTVSGGGFSLSPVLWEPCSCDVEASLKLYDILDL